MKTQTFHLVAAIGMIAIALLATLPSSRGQATVATDEAAIATLVAELTAQQTLIIQNQAKIDSQIAEISEDIRQARIFVARGGGATRR